MKKSSHENIFPCRRRLLFAVLLSAALVLLLLTIGIYRQIHAVRIPAEAESRDTLILSASGSPVLYTLRVHEGRIGIFTQGEPSPTEVMEIWVFTLPLADRRALAEGIPIHSEEELQARIEDFTG